MEAKGSSQVRWHEQGCKAPAIVTTQGLPSCRACNKSPDLEMLLTVQKTSTLGTEIPPDEPFDKMNLWWPPSVPYRKAHDTPGPEIVGERHQDKDETTKTARHASTLSTNIANAIYEGNLGPESFRLACLEPIPTLDDNNPIVHVTLETYELNNHPEYEAVSYTWGGENNDSSRKHPIYFGPYWDVLFQTKNCWDMLRFCIPTRGIRLLWVDALCINQSSIRDRGIQVANMGRIYRECQKVVVYLGPDITPDLPPNQYPRRYLLQNIETAKSSSLRERQLDLGEVLARRYFTRIWVTQELVLPRQAVMRIGDVDFTLDLSTREFLHEATPSTAAPWLQYGISGGVLEGSICELMARTAMSDSQDPRDRLFGILGLVGPQAENPGYTAPLRVDYSLSYQAVSIGFFYYCLIKLKMPHILLGSRGLIAGDNLPSWVPDWSSKNLWNCILARRLSEYDSDELRKALLQDPVAEIFSQPSNVCSVGVLERDSPLSCGSATEWETRFQVDSQTGALTMRLTRLCIIRSNLAFFKDTKGGRMFVAQYENHGLGLISHFALDEIVRPGLDEIFFLDTPSKTNRIFLILRKLGNSSNWRVVASCDLFFIGFNDHKTIYPFMNTDKMVFPNEIWELHCVNAHALLAQLATPIQSSSLQWLLPDLEHVNDLLVYVFRAVTEEPLGVFMPVVYLKSRHTEDWSWLRNRHIRFYFSRDKWDHMPPSIHDEFAEFASKVALQVSTHGLFWVHYPVDPSTLSNDSDVGLAIDAVCLLSWVGSLVNIPWENLAVAELVSERNGGRLDHLLQDEKIQYGEYWMSNNGVLDRRLCEELEIDGSSCQVTIV
ncbi:heterokaryon incompatibility het-6 [Fusarium albosuccineum]|uniref:Heterokaryon incompatibility het-6 n=1 Tax=Fusarium albosuccineum TaxID=1237068 RepID=A0A8H4LL61_9HYPO|nr:heterokaryon incompatibility het-6 [Fusarium albosuccineum]